MTGTMEERILQLIRAKDPQGIEECRKYFGALMRYVIEPILQDPEDCEDCIQTVLSTIWEKIGSYDQSRGSLKTWIAAVTRNAALKMVRGKHQTEPYEELPEDTPSGEPGAEELLLKKELIRELRKALESLSPLERQFIYRRYYFNQAVAQIAAEFGISEKAAEGRLYRIRNKLRDILGGGYFDE